MFRFVASHLRNLLENLISEGFFCTGVILQIIKKAEIKTFIPVILLISTLKKKKSVWLDNITATDISLRTYDILDYFKLVNLEFCSVNRKWPSDSMHILFW